jgi:hypothetical protein
VFGEEYRPVKIETKLHTYSDHTSDFMFDKSLNYQLHALVRKYSHDRPALVFCATRKGYVSAVHFVLYASNDARAAPKQRRKSW